MASEELFEIERIEKDCFMLDTDGVNQRHFLIKWVDYPPHENTWEPRSNLTQLASEILKEYETRIKNRIDHTKEDEIGITSHTKQSVDVIEQNTQKVHPVLDQESSDSSDSDCPIMSMALPTATTNTQQTTIKKNKAPILIQTNSKESSDSEDEPIVTTTAFERIPKYDKTEAPRHLPPKRPKRALPWLLPQNRHKKIAPPPKKKRKVNTNTACTTTIDLISDDEMPVSNPISIISSRTQQRKRKRDTSKPRYNTHMHKKRYNCKSTSTQQNTINCTRKNDVTTNFLYSVYPCVRLEAIECAVSSCPSILSMPPSMDAADSLNALPSLDIFSNKSSSYSSRSGSHSSHKEKRHRHRHGERARHKHKHKERHKRHKSSRHKKERSYDSNHNRSMDHPSMTIEGDANAPPPPPRICPVYLEEKDSNKKRKKPVHVNIERQLNILTQFEQMHLEMPIPSVKVWTSRFRIFGCDANITMCAQDIIHVKASWDGIHIDEEMCANKNEDDQSESRQQSVPMSISIDST
eukprot:807955_1